MTSEFKVVPIGDIYPDPDQPRKTGFADEDLDGMVQSLASCGLIQTLRVTEDGQGKYMIVSGERRYRAALKAGLMEVPVMISGELSEVERLEIQLVENMLRRDLDVRERAEAIARFTKLHPDQQTAAKRLGLSKGHLSNLLELTDLAPEVAALSSSKVTRDATTLVMTNQLFKKAPEKAAELIAQAKETGKLPRKTVMDALAPHRRKKKKAEEASPVAETTVPAVVADAVGMEPSLPPSVAAASPPPAAEDASEVMVRAPRAKIRRVCKLLRISEDTDYTVVVEKLLDQYLAGAAEAVAA